VIFALGYCMEPLEKRQIQALRKAAGVGTFRFYLDLNDSLLDLATKGGRKSEMKKLARTFYEAKRKL